MEPAGIDTSDIGACKYVLVKLVFKQAIDVQSL